MSCGAARGAAKAGDIRRRKAADNRVVARIVATENGRVDGAFQRIFIVGRLINVLEKAAHNP